MAEAGEIARAVIEYTQGGMSTGQNVFFWELKSGGDDSDLMLDIVEWVEDNWGAEWATFANDAALIISVSVDIVDWVIDSINVIRNIGTEPLAIAGTQAFDQQAGGVAATIFAATERPKSRGRKYIPSVSETSIDDGLYDAALLADLAIMLLHYVSLFNGGTGFILQPGVISTVTETFLPFLLSGGFDDIPDYMRSRRPDEGS